MTEKEALKLALEALEYRGVGSWRKKQPAITAIKQVLANEALERKAENARELGLDYEPEIAQDENKKESAPTKEWWASFLSPPIDYRKMYGEPLEFDSVDRYYMAMQRQIDKEKNT